MASDSKKPKKTSRRDLLIGTAAVLAVGGGWQVYVRRPREFDFQPIDGLPGWRQLSFTGLSRPSAGVAGAAFIGVDAETDQVQPLAPERLCRTLFEGNTDGVPVAVFSDFFCPYCRTFTPKIAERAAAGNDISLTWHELPLISPSSEIAARAAIAADMQGGYEAFQSTLLQSNFRPTMGFLRDVAAKAGLSVGSFLFDMDSGVVRSRLSRSRAAARTLGIYGTPAMVVGRTMVMGEMSEGDFDRLIALEAADAAGVC